MERKENQGKITSYEAFVHWMERVGFMPLSPNPVGLVNLTELTHEENWHTGLETDPWAWRVRLEQERRGAYGKVFYKKPGFIAMDWYPRFLAARRKGRSLLEMYEDGLISQHAKAIYGLFEEHEVLAAYEIKSLAGFKKETIAKFEGALAELQMKLFITSNGTKRKINGEGEPYGWPSTAFSTVETWGGPEMMEAARALSWEEAAEDLIRQVQVWAPGVSLAKAKSFAGI